MLSLAGLPYAQAYRRPTAQLLESIFRSLVPSEEYVPIPPRSATRSMLRATMSLACALSKSLMPPVSEIRRTSPVVDVTKPTLRSPLVCLTQIGFCAVALRAPGAEKDDQISR